MRPGAILSLVFILAFQGLAAPTLYLCYVTNEVRDECCLADAPVTDTCCPSEAPQDGCECCGAISDGPAPLIQQASSANDDVLVAVPALSIENTETSDSTNVAAVPVSRPPPQGPPLWLLHDSFLL